MKRRQPLPRPLRSSTSRLRNIALSFASFLLAGLLQAPPAAAATFFVTNTNTSGAGSLAQAILNANLTAAADDIEFLVLSLGTVTIDGPFPAITSPLLIDGYTQGNAAPNTAAQGSNALIRVQLDAGGLDPGQALLQVDADDVTIQGLAIVDLEEDRIGIRVAAGAEATVISGNFIGVFVNGTTDSSTGIGIRNEGTNTLIGGDTTLAQRNLLSANDGAGIDERGVGTVIANNLIGTDDSGAGVLGNGTGILVSGGAAGGILIGGPNALSPNLIAGNEGDGITVQSTTGGNVQIERNRIRGNGGLGIDLGGDGVTPNDEADADSGPNSLQNHPVLTFARVVDGTDLSVQGYLVGPADNYQLEFYLVGDEPDPSGFGEGSLLVHVQALGSAGPVFRFRYLATLSDPISDGIYLTATAQNTSTHETSEFSNAVEIRNGGDEELVVTSAADSGPGSLRAIVAEANADPGPNYVAFALPLPVQPINLQTTIEITEEIVLDGYTQIGALVNALDFGTDAELRVQINGASIPSGGTLFINADRVVLRGLVISGKGIAVQYSTGNSGRIEGCFIGTNAAGTADANNGSHGIFTGSTTSGITIGGDLPSQRNLVSGNSTHGMRITGDNAVIRGNIVGADATGLLPIPNSANGISVEGENVEVGVDAFDDSRQNLVAFNTGNGITVSSVTTKVTIRGNSVHSNGLLGIDLASDTPGVTPNDPDDVDTGANNLQNFPEIAAVESGASQVEVSGSLDGGGDFGTTDYRIGVYANESCDDSGHGEGQLFLGSRVVALSNANDTFLFSLPMEIADGVAVTMTAAREGKNQPTSEFSECFIVGADVAVCGDASGDGDLAAGDALTVLKTAVGTAVCEECVCNVNSAGGVTATDALLVLRAAVGQPVDLDCPACD